MVKLSNCSQSSVTANLEKMGTMQKLNLSEGMDQAEMAKLIEDIEPLAQLKVEYQKQVTRMD